VQAVVETPGYLRNAETEGATEQERAAIIDELAQNPSKGEPMVGTGGARKFRFARPGRGKSGGYRIVSYYGGDDIPVFLLGLFSKGTKANLSRAERNDLRRELVGMAADYRAGMKKRIRAV